MKLLAYLRVSTNNQTGEDKYGFESQLVEIEKYCKDNNHEIVEVVREQISGAKDDRPLFNEILYGEKEVDYEGVIVAKIDRLSRNVENYFGFKYFLKKRNLELISANENEDFSKMGAFAKVYETLISVFAEIERERINSRMSGGRNVKANGGGYGGGKAPYGYKVAYSELAIDEYEKNIVLLVFELKSQDKSLGFICDELERQGYKTRSNKSNWSKSTIKSILDNEEFYKGTYQYGSCNATIGKYEPILKA